MKHLSIKKVSLYGFSTVFSAFIITIILVQFYINKIDCFEQENALYEESYSSLLQFRYHTESLLTTYNLKSAIKVWHISRDEFEKYFKSIQSIKSEKSVDFRNFWNVILDESKKIEKKLKNPLFNKKNTQERSLLRRLGENLENNKFSDYYYALVSLKNSIDHIKQYELFLLEELATIKMKGQSQILQELKTAKLTLYVLLFILTLASTILLFFVVKHISRIEFHLKQSNREKKILNTQLLDNYEKSLYALVTMIEERDTYTGGHSQRVANYAVTIAKEMGYENEELIKINQAGMLHDIGKMNIPDAILLKPGRLDFDEYTLIKTHAENGYNFLKQIPMYKEFAEIILYHHEHYNGKGYPRQKKHDEIPMFSYIISVADAFDAMTTSRIYQARKNVKEAIEEISRCSGTQFHPMAADAAIKALHNVNLDRNISQVPYTLLEMQRFSYFYKDQLTGLFNEAYLNLLLKKNFKNSKYFYASKFLIHNFSQYNSKFGWKSGDKIIGDIANYLKVIYQEGKVFRLRGDDFIVLSKEKIVIDENAINALYNSVDISIEYSCINIGEEAICTIEDIIDF